MSTVALLRKTDECEGADEVRGNVLFDLPRIERAVREILFAVGEDPDRDGLVETPRRVARAYGELLGGLREDPARHLGRVFEHRTENDDLVLVRDVEFSSLCEHHLLPFNGTAQVGHS
jgi:GTP cyclohydrolase I